MGGIRKQRGFGRTADAGDTGGDAEASRAEEGVEAVAAYRDAGFGLELRERVIQSRAKPHLARGQIGVEHAGGEINGALAFGSIAQPAEPIKLAVVRLAVIPLKTPATIVVPIQLAG